MSPDDAGTLEADPEPVQILTIRSNRVYLPADVRAAFGLHDGDKLVIYSVNGKMSIRITRKLKPMHPANSNR